MLEGFRIASEWLCVPAYAPNLQLMARFGRFVKKQCRDSKYSPDSPAFQRAILSWIHHAPMAHQAALHQRLTVRVQTLQDVAVIGEPQTIAKTSKKNVLSKAA